MEESGFNNEKQLIVNKETKRIKDIINDLSVEYYNISPIFHKMDMHPDCELGSYACVDENGKGLFNPFMINALSNEDVKFVMMHEAFHVLLKHVNRYKKIREDYDYFAYWNYATDAFINENLFKTFNSKIEGIVDYSVVAEMAGIERKDVCKHSSESLFELIVEHQKELWEQQQQEQQNNDSGDNEDNGENQGQSNQSSNKNSNNNGSMSNFPFQSNGNDSSSSSNDNNAGSGSPCSNDPNPCVNDKSTIEAVKKFFDKKSKKQENLFDGYDDSTDIYEPSTGNNVTDKSDDEIIRDIIKKNVDWKKALDDFVTEVSGKHDVVKSWRRPNRKYRDYYPMSKGRVRRGHKKFVFSIDVSGSMDQEKINAVVAVIDNYVKKVRVGCEYYFFNTMRYENIKFDNISKFSRDYNKVKGGGTSFSAAIDCGDVDGLVIISDMEFSFDSKISDLDEKNIPYKLIDIDPNGTRIPAIVNNDNYVAIY